MKLKTLAIAIALGVGVSSASQAAEMWFDTNGGGANPPGTVIGVGAFDWDVTNIFAEGGTTAIGNFDVATQTCLSDCSFTVYTHARLANYKDGTGAIIGGTGLNDAGSANAHEITMTWSFDQEITGITLIGGQAIATFSVVTPDTHFEMYWDENLNSRDLTGFGFNDGDLIAASSVISDADGIFSVTVGDGAVTLDQFGGNDYNGPGGNQQTVVGSGSDGVIKLDEVELDKYFFKDELSAQGFQFGSIGQTLPNINVDPSSCYTTGLSGNVVSDMSSTAAFACTDVHVDDVFSAQTNAGAGGTLPIIGLINGLSVADNGGPDFVAQADFNMSVDAVSKIPLPGGLVLLGTGLSALGFFGGTRKRKIS